ncbi:unnamed protein product, partial [Lampetra planeri]
WRCEERCRHGTYGSQCQQSCQCQNAALVSPHDWRVYVVRQDSLDLSVKMSVHQVNTVTNVRRGAHVRMEGVCHHVTGECSCSAGWMGTVCAQPCPPGRFGLNCSHTCQCHNNGLCVSTTGECVCSAGYTGER